MTTETGMEMPQYRCHKRVWALQIEKVTTDPRTGDAVLTFTEKPYAPRRVDASYRVKHDPQPGGYFVVYEGGYESFSPAGAFESGYSRIETP